MPSSRHSSRIDTLELKARIVKKLGHQKAEKYFHHLSRFLSMKIGKSEFDKLCIIIIGKENVPLHNYFLKSIIKNACVAKTPPPKSSKVEVSIDAKPPNGYQISNSNSNSGDLFPPSPRWGRSSSLRDRMFKDRLSPLGPNGKIQGIMSEELEPKTQEQQSATELFSLGSRPPGEVISVEEGEEVEQVRGSPSVQSRSPVRAPLGIPMNNGGARKTLRGCSLMEFHQETGHNSYELPDTRTLKKLLERKFEAEGLSISTESVNLLNNGLDSFLKRLIKPCLELARSRRGIERSHQVNVHAMHGLNQRSNRTVSACMLDFRAAMELNPQLLGEDWPVQLERICLHTSEE